VVIALAILGALVESRLAPEAWPSDGARVQVSYFEQVVIEEVVAFDGAAVALSGPAGEATVSLAIAGGLTSGDPIRDELRVECGGVVVRPEPGGSFGAAGAVGWS
jgi:hypothetical protein